MDVRREKTDDARRRVLIVDDEREVVIALGRFLLGLIAKAIGPKVTNGKQG